MRMTFDCSGSPEIHLAVLKAICGDTKGKSMIDLGCGFAPQTRQLGFKFRLYVDIVTRDLKEENENFKNVDILNNDLDSFWDVSFSLDNIEHFKKMDGYFLLREMKIFSIKQIIFTPIGDYLIEKYATENPDSHKSGWMPEEFEEMEWATIVFNNFHQTLGIGAFFAFNCENMKSEFLRISNELSWIK